MPNDDKPDPTIRELHALAEVEARLELARPRRTTARPLAEAWCDLDTAMRAPVLPGQFPEPLPEGWGERLPAGHYPVPDGSLAVSVNEPALIFHDGNGNAYRLDKAAFAWGGAPTDRRGRAFLEALLNLAQQDVAGLAGLCHASGAEHRIYETCDRKVEHEGDHTAGRYTWAR